MIHSYLCKNCQKMFSGHYSTRNKFPDEISPSGNFYVHIQVILLIFVLDFILYILYILFHLFKKNSNTIRMNEHFSTIVLSYFLLLLAWQPVTLLKGLVRPPYPFKAFWATICCKAFSAVQRNIHALSLLSKIFIMHLFRLSDIFEND